MSVYPGALDAFAPHAGEQRLVGPDVDAIAAAINRVQAELGLEPSGAAATVAAALSAKASLSTNPADAGKALDARGGAPLSVGSGVLSAKIFRTTAFTAANAPADAVAARRIPLDATSFDAGGCVGSGTDAGKLVIPPGGTGVYVANTQVTYAAAGAGLRVGVLFVNGVNTADNPSQPASSGPTGVNFGTLLMLNATDVVELGGYQDSGAGLALLTGVKSTYLSLCRISRA